MKLAIQRKQVTNLPKGAYVWIKFSPADTKDQRFEVICKLISPNTTRIKCLFYREITAAGKDKKPRKRVSLENSLTKRKAGPVQDFNPWKKVPDLTAHRAPPFQYGTMWSNFPNNSVDFAFPQMAYVTHSKTGTKYQWITDNYSYYELFIPSVEEVVQEIGVYMI